MKMAEGNSSNVKVNIGMISIIVLLIAQLIGFAFGYGMLTQQVGFNREIIKQYQETQFKVMEKLDTLSSRLTIIEAQVSIAK